MFSPCVVEQYVQSTPPPHTHTPYTTNARHLPTVLYKGQCTYLISRRSRGTILSCRTLAGGEGKQFLHSNTKLVRRVNLSPQPLFSPLECAQTQTPPSCSTVKWLSGATDGPSSAIEWQQALCEPIDAFIRWL